MTFTALRPKGKTPAFLNPLVIFAGITDLYQARQKNGIESNLCQYTSWVALIEPMAFLLPMLLEWSKQTNVKGLALMRGVWHAPDGLQAMI